MEPSKRRRKFPEHFARLPTRLLDDDSVPDKAKSLFLLLDRSIQRGEDSPARGWLAAKLNCSERYVSELSAALEARDYIRVHRLSGCLNRYELLPGTPEPQFPGTPEPQFPGTPEPQFPGTPEPQFPGRPISPNKGFQNLREREPAPSQGADNSPPAELRQRDMFHEGLIRQAVEFEIGEHPDDRRLAALRPWFPELVEKLFALKRWCRVDDPGTAALWAGEFARHGAAEAETREAIDWVKDNPPLDRRGDPRFGRDDWRFAIIARMRDQRRVAQMRGEAARAPAAAGDAVWRGATEQERAEVLRRVGRYRNSSTETFFSQLCARELLKLREAANAATEG